MKSQKPLVGFVGSENSIAVVRKDDRIVCQLAKRTYGYLLIMSFLFGPALITLLLVKPDRVNIHLPLVIKFPLVSMSLISCFFFRTLTQFPRIEVLKSSGDILFFKTRSLHPSWITRREEIQGFEVERQTYLKEGSRLQNHVLSVVVRNRDKIPLCVSVDESMIQVLLADFKEITGIH